MQTLLRLQINALCVAVLAVALFSVGKSGSARRRRPAIDLVLFKIFVYSTIVMLITDAFSWILDGYPGTTARTLQHVNMTVYYGFHALPTSLYILYSEYMLNKDLRRLRNRIRFLALLNAIQATVALASLHTGWLYYLDQGNQYQRGRGFTIFAVFIMGLTLLAFLPVVLGRGKTSRRVYITLLWYPLPILAVGLVQSLYFGLVLIWPATTIFLIAAALNIQRLRSATDHLTGTANRRSLDESLEHLIKGAASGKKFGALLLDLNDFKKINDTLGHDVGDRALEQAALILKSVVRQDDLVARYGGDEFVLLLPGATETSLGEIAARIRTISEDDAAGRGQPFALSFSIGAALYDPQRDTGADGFLARLDAAMYQNKMERKKTRQPEP